MSTWMSSDEDWTHHWLMTSMAPSGPDAIDNELEIHEQNITLDKSYNLELSSDDPLGMAQIQAPDEGPPTSPVASIDLDRESPMICDMDEDEGPPSIETQPPDQFDVELSGIGDSWHISNVNHETSQRIGMTSPACSDTPFSSMVESEIDVTTVPRAVDDYRTSKVIPYNNSIKDLSPISVGDIADDSATGGLCGLRNLGNTCFMAAGLQCLVNTPPIAQYFFNHTMEGEAKSSLAGCFSQLTHKMWSGKYSSLRPMEFKEAFGAHWRDFRDYRQHDCQEFMTLLLEALRKQMLLGEDNPSVNDSENDNVNPMKHINYDHISHPNIAESFSSCRSSLSNLEGSGEGSPGSLSPSPPRSPQCLPSPEITSHPFETRSDTLEDTLGLDSGGASPKSSISSESVDSHLISLRLQPIPEEVKRLSRAVSSDADSIGYSNASFSLTPVEGLVANENSRVSIVRKYNHLTESPAENLLLSENHSHNATTFDSPEVMDVSSTFNSQYTHKCSNDNNNANENSLLSIPNSSHLALVKLEDIMKESKTSNVNVLAKDNLPNNEFVFDSEKYAKCDVKRIKNSVDNLNRSGLKRVKEVNILVDKLDNSQIDPDIGSKLTLGKNELAALNKRIRLEEKNIQYEIERNQPELLDRLSTENLPSQSPIRSEYNGRSLVEPVISPEDQQNAEDSWKSFVGISKSAVIDTFYGQFRSSLICSVCSHTSVRFDPFGTLSVPLPHANEVQIPVIFVPYDGTLPIRYLVTLFKISTVHDLKKELINLCQSEISCLLDSQNIIIAEVFDNHIARTIDDSYSCKFLNTTTRSIYAFELIPYVDNAEMACISRSVSKDDAENVNEHSDSSNSFMSAVVVSTDAQWEACNICLEELCQTDLKTHDSCEDCLLCDNCIEMSCKHHGKDCLPCPVCQANLKPSQLIPVASRKSETPKARILRVPVVFRIDTESDDNNKREMVLTGHPRLLSLPSRISLSTLIQIVKDKFVNCPHFSLLLVDGRGYNCSRCLFSSHCRGCDASREGSEILLRASDTLCVRLTEIPATQKDKLGELSEHQSMSSIRANEPLTIYDCLRAFTQSEVLQESESWFCPKCEKKQRATKTISVWKFPPYLIIHLERFLFHGTTSVKLDDKVLFPIDGLDLSAFCTGDKTTPHLYELYSCVCHMGVAQAGHYTALVRSPVNEEWHYFNDDSVTRQKPGDEEYSTSYLLFYHRQGTKFNLRPPENINVSPRLNNKIVGNNNLTTCPASSPVNETVIPSAAAAAAVSADLSRLADQRLSRPSLSPEAFYTSPVRLHSPSARVATNSPIRGAEY